MDVNANHRRKSWFQFRLASLFWMTLVVASFLCGNYWNQWMDNLYANNPPNLSAWVSLNFDKMPLCDVMSRLGSQANVTVELDERGLANQQVESSQPVTIRLTAPVSLKSALSLILDPLRLSHYIRNGKVIVTSKDFVSS